MIFALGFLCSGLLSLLFFPLVWRRAVRLSRRRLEMQMPLSMTEIVAERDQLRAEFALGRRRLEQKLESLAESRAKSLAEIGRAAIVASQMQSDLEAARKEGALLGEERDRGRARVAELESQLSALNTELYDNEGLLRRRMSELAEARRSLAAAADLAEQRRATIGALETRISASDMKSRDLLRDLAALRQSHSKTAKEARGLAQALNAVKSELLEADAHKTELEETLRRLEERIAERETALGRSRQSLAEAKSEIADLSHELALAEERAKALRGSLERQTETRRAQERDNAQRLQNLAAQIETLKDSEAGARSELFELRREAALARARRPKKDPSPAGNKSRAPENAGREPEPEPNHATDALLGDPT